MSIPIPSLSTNLPRHVRKSLIFNVYTLGTNLWSEKGSEALWTAFVAAVKDADHLPEHIELCMHGAEATFTEVIEAVLTRTTETTLSVHLDGRYWSYEPWRRRSVTLLQAFILYVGGGSTTRLFDQTRIQERKPGISSTPPQFTSDTTRVLLGHRCPSAK